MTIKSYFYHDPRDDHFKFDKVELGKLNLIVGNTGCGKTRFLNTIFNLGSFISGKTALFGSNQWELLLEIRKELFEYKITVSDKDGKCYVKSEQLNQIQGSTATSIISRSENIFMFYENRLPKLSQNQSAINLLKEEDIIKPLFIKFSSIMRRYFSGDELTKATSTGVIANELIKDFSTEKNLRKLFSLEMDISSKLYLLEKAMPEIYNKIQNCYLEVFPFIQRCRIFDRKEMSIKSPFPGVAPVFQIKEKNINNWIDISELSSGMKKVLLIMTDLCTLPEDATYLIDEYENSLGVNAIDFFPTFLLEFESDAQIILTSHHPYIINNISPSNWVVCHRKGTEVSFRLGKDILEKMGSSKHQYFTQLINDPFYNEGIE